ncbi:hypothetical protein [Serinibacter salmoneus]|uniref:Uncharacterized protein n=1 Tax=Serinibacter salmoneus TaxID=556530 RepID=A0A2A9D0B0_9MICO|nr:hypothetical protein [Serinibacter salmoneus]PFG20104.1 hypothetical protein ATL40_1688 [Serinibacter salmoneus]
MSEEKSERPLTRRELREQRQLAERAEAAAQATAANLTPVRDDDAATSGGDAAPVSGGAADRSGQPGAPAAAPEQGAQESAQPQQPQSPGAAWLQAGGHPPTRRSRRQQTQTAIPAATAGEHIADTSSSPSVPPDAAVSRETPSPGPSRPPSRRSMRDMPAPATPSRGERMPAPGPREADDQGEAAPSTPSVVPPARAQGVRRLESTGELSAVRSTRAREDSRVEITGPIDWSSSMIPAVTEDTPAPDGAGAPASSSTPTTPTAPTTPTERPRRVSVLGNGGATPSWGGVNGSAGAAVPRRPPEVSGALSRPPLKPDELAREAAASLEAEGFTPRPRWVVPLAIVGLIVLGVALGTGAYFLFFE